MSALTENRNTPRRDGDFYEHPVAADTVIFQGAIVALNAAGDAVPATDAANLIVVGRAEYQADNTGGDAGAVRVRVRKGVFGFETATLTKANIGDTVYCADDQTVTSNAGSHTIAAGTLMAVDSYAWVRIN